MNLKFKVRNVHYRTSRFRIKLIQTGKYTLLFILFKFTTCFCFLGSIHGIGKLLASSAVIHTSDSKYTKFTVNYFVAEEYTSKSHFPQSNCASIE